MNPVAVKPVPAVGKAHGRVNLIGEHTDYNGGFVLPTAIPQFTTVRLTPHADSANRTVHIRAAHDPLTGVAREIKYPLGHEKKSGQWWDYLAGATHLLGKMGHQFNGFELDVESTVPEGSGLSSSAALEISFLKALRSAYSLSLTDIELAQLGQRIENEFVGARIGIMDQMACCFAKAGEALFLDTQSMKHEPVKLPLESLDLIVINSGVTHQNSGGSYNQRRGECEEACVALKINSLRELAEDGLDQINRLPDPIRQRARHVFTENQRVHATVAAIRRGDLKKVGALFYESHASMRDDYRVSVPEIDLLVELCRKEPRVYGARLTGGGFGGSVVAISEKGSGREIAERVVQAYAKETQRQATILVPEKGMPS